MKTFITRHLAAKVRKTLVNVRLKATVLKASHKSSNLLTFF